MGKVHVSEFSIFLSSSILNIALVCLIKVTAFPHTFVLYLTLTQQNYCNTVIALVGSGRCNRQTQLTEIQSETPLV